MHETAKNDTKHKLVSYSQMYSSIKGDSGGKGQFSKKKKYLGDNFPERLKDN